ncbi:ABC transporter ATP-binding protein [Mucilaginibacter ginkgonis]|uniref:ATP-binding cassette domain-containing protein n=1 Tax=Mucilaginibacter ginkgonis TaxID=2682091 RepID=A0A6I4IMJ7_9SPHI|nr:polysaccharide ABC transporter ATP-binding protein [Mucilaginibacter ginkgonis]QQL50194.1 ATP-binding cassette domain-containing protein [Mucilaginibacter ginkgonis]
MSTVIKIENVSKAYRLGEINTGTLSSDLHRWWSRARGKEDPYLKIGESKGSNDVVWSLRDINLEIEKGEAVGIIGRNGAGKSTLLKILSRVTTPTSGTVKAHGRIASLLEVGTGFHPDLTGRENIFLNGAILGMRKREIELRFDAIVDFSGVERYIDTPVKRYSSGMYVRLAFAVAAHLESEILIVDEVLAVGDAEFQKKCLGKMGEVVNGEGRTILFVSHNMDAISRLCSSCIFLKKGSMIEKASTNKVISSYLSSETKANSFITYDHDLSAPGDDFIKLRKAEAIDVTGLNKTNFSLGEKIGIHIVFQIYRKMRAAILGLNLYNKFDVHILSSHDLVNGVSDYEPGIYESVVWLPANFMAEGLHYCGVAAMSVNPFTIHFNDINKFVFNVIDDLHDQNIRKHYGGDIPGVVRPMLEWNVINKLTY